VWALCVARRIAANIAKLLELLRIQEGDELSAFKEMLCTSSYNYSRKYDPSENCRNSIIFKK
jgi:hypothetical protein